MARVIEDTRQAQFGDAKFFMTRIETEEGVNRAKYLFLNSSRRVQKPLGIFPPIFNVSGYTASADADEYRKRKNALRANLSSAEGKTFVHPWDGNAFCTCDGKYKFEETFGEVNKCIFSITFCVVSEDGSNPQPITGAQVSPSNILNQSLDANRSLQSSSASLFESNTVQNKEVSKSLFDNAGNSLNDTFSGIGDQIASISDYTEKALNIADQAQFYIDNPLIGFGAVADGILGVDDLTTDVYAKFRAVQAFFDWGASGTDFSTDVSSPFIVDQNPITQESAERLRNVEAMQNYMQCASCLEAYNQGAQIPYSNSTEIDDVIDIMEQQFSDIQTLVTYDRLKPVNIAGIDYSDFYNQISQLRVDFLQLLSEIRIQTPTIEVVTIRSGIPASKLAYMLYGDSSRFEEIMELNGTFDPYLEAGDVMVYSK